jgi:cell division transport system permease protein
MQRWDFLHTATNFFYIYQLKIMSEQKINVSRTKKGGVNYFYSILGVAMVLFLLGILGWIFINAGELSKSFKESVQVSVIFNDNTDDALGLKLKGILEQQDFTKSVDYITKDQALEDWQKISGEDSKDLLEFNPLYSSINVHLKSKYINTDSLTNVKKFIMQSNIVREVDIQKNLVDLMNGKIQKLGLIILGISILLILIVVFLIDNTIKLAMYSNRFLIKTMQYVGATRYFITKPFAIRSITNGVISGVLAILGVLFIKAFAEGWMPELKGIQNNKWMIGLYIIIIFLGVIISLFSTYRSVIKYLKTSLDELY